MYYIIGEPLFSDIKLSPGKRLERIGGREIRGVGTTYAYLSPGISFSVCYSEDADLASENLLRAGAIKLWLLIKPAYNEELERRMRREFLEIGHCSQALRQLSRIIPLSKLDEWGIEYSLVCIALGELMVTQRGTRHQVLNLGPNYALTINILYGSSLDIPLDYRFCSLLKESEDPQTIARLPIEDLTTFIEEFPIIEETEFKVPPSDKLYDLYDLYEIDKKCDYIITCLPANKPYITNEAGKGQGVRVEGMTYQKGQILGQLAGEFAPLDTYNNG
ncbi:hypothetical protein G7Y89_g3514 [Cudoniella acicularis]|uniref:JmjC domain-containing protein n=1 Tax=Cudoniella acicularis TaxID=354080 RepID=A0A8H4W543_9HELO|nr:hypothetical protein G7Y89_g3514 [Cudoniella acicularis]